MVVMPIISESDIIMSIKDRLLENGAIITTTETNFGEYRKEVELWYRKNSQALRESVDILLKLYPDLTLRCVCQPITKNMCAMWKTANSYDPNILVTLDIEDCSHCNLDRHISLEAFLAKIREHGPKDSMTFRITMGGNIWQQIIAKGNNP